MPKHFAKGQEAPGIVLCQGFSGEKDKVLPSVATAFASAGYVTLAFDYGGCGESGNRRERPYVFPNERVEDAICAIAHVSQLPFVDSERIGLYGLSYGGPVAIHVASFDRRIKCVSVVSGPGDGLEFLSSLMDKSDWQSLTKEIEDDRAYLSKTGQSKLIPLTRVINFPQSFWTRYALLDSEKESESLPTSPINGRQPMLSLESADAIMRFRPKTVVGLIAPRPILFIHGEKDDVAKIELARGLYEKAGHPKQFVDLPGMDHIDLDTGAGLQKQVSISLEWFNQYL